MFPFKNVLKQGHALSPLLFSFVLEYDIRSFHVNQEGLKLNGTHQLLFYANNVNILDKSVCTIKKNIETSVAASKETGLEVNTEKTKDMIMSQDMNSRENHNIKTDNKSFERVEQFKYLGTILTNQNSIQEEIKSRCRSENDSYHLVRILSSSLLSKNINIIQYT